MKALVLDFDGVLADSAPEAFEVALRTYTQMRPGSALPGRDRDDLYAGFLEIMPLGNRAEDFGVALLALEASAPLPDQPAYDDFRAAVDPAWLEAFHGRFYATREAWSESDLEGWLAQTPPYPAFLEVLRRRAGEAAFAIATAKDHRSVTRLLGRWGARDLFAPELVLDKETGVHKTAHLEQLARALGLPFVELTFVDDKVNHLDAAAALGVRCALAAWGMNGPREHALARQRGHLVCSLGDVEALLFGVDGRRPGV